MAKIIKHNVYNMITDYTYANNSINIPEILYDQTAMVPDKHSSNIAYAVNDKFIDEELDDDLENIKLVVPAAEEEIESSVDDEETYMFDIGDSFVISIKDIFEFEEEIYYKLSNELVVTNKQLLRLVAQRKDD